MNKARGFNGLSGCVPIQKSVRIRPYPFHQCSNLTLKHGAPFFISQNFPLLMSNEE